MTGRGELSLYTEPVSGFRSWRVTQDGVLTGATYRVPWEAGELQALCYRLGPGGQLPPRKTGRHPAPDMDCACGFYALDSYERVQEGKHVWGDNVHGVRGVAIGWGRVVIGERGWRAEHARPVALLHWPTRRVNVNEPFAPGLMETKAEQVNALVRRAAEYYGAAYVDTVEELQAIAAASGAKPVHADA